MILVVDEKLQNFEKIEDTSFYGLNIWERTHIQEWIRQAPEILGEELLVVSIEFERFKTSNDRLDLLAVDRDGNLVVVEIKKDSYAGYAELQAIRYAAMVSSMTIEKLAQFYNSYLIKHLKQTDATVENSLLKIQEFINSDDSFELSNTPRIILCSKDFSQEITTTVLWLNQNGLDISCVKITPHNLGDKIVIVPNKIIPLKEANQYLIEIKEKEVQESKGRRNRPLTMRILIENKILNQGDKIYLKNGLPGHLKYKKDDPFFSAVITGKLGKTNSIKWDYDNHEYAISALTWNIFKNTHPDKKDPGGINGNWHWVNEKGKNLWDLAESFWNKNNLIEH